MLRGLVGGCTRNGCVRVRWWRVAGRGGWTHLITERERTAGAQVWRVGCGRKGGVASVGGKASGY